MRILKKPPVVILFFMMAQQAVFAQPHLTAIQQIINDAKIPAISLAYLKDGKLQEQYNIGVKSAESKELINDSTVFAACSLSKSVFSYGVYKLIKNKRLDPDRPLYLYCDYKDVDADERYK